jgi:hypothetical protein
MMTRKPGKKADDIMRKPQSEQHTLEKLQRDISAGLRQIDEGKSSPFDEAAVERIKNLGRKKLAKLKSQRGSNGRMDNI